MNNRLSYKLGALIFGVSTLAVIFLIFAQYTHSSFINNKDREMALEDELRMHRQVFIDLKNSNDPQVNPELRHECDEGIAEINQILYREREEELSPEEEYRIRRRLREITEMIKEEYGYKVMNEGDSF